MNLCEIRIQPRYAETDQMGVVYHASYLPWFEMCRDDFFRKMGYSYNDLERSGVLMPVLNISCQYKASVSYDDEVIVSATLVKFKGSRVQFKYDVIKASDKSLLTEAYVDYTFTNKKLQPVNLRRLNQEFWNILMDTIA